VTKLTDTLAQRAVERSVGDLRAEYAEQIERVLEATYDLIERTGNVDPSLRDILRATGLSTQAFYRYFQSKDELLLLLLDDGRRKLLGYLEHRMQRVSMPDERVRAWIEGVLAQAANERAASRTRPFVANQDRLTEAFPVEQQASADLLVDQLTKAVEAITTSGEPRRDATAIYEVAFGTLHRHLVQKTRPTARETDHLVRFCLRAIGVGRDPEQRS
jgi:AcrR family transcriptional regulator